MNKQSAAVGVLILAAGLVILLGKLGVFAFIGTVFWPLFILIPGILLHVLFFAGLLPALSLIPGAILTVVSVILLIGNWFDWGAMKYLWPFFMFAVSAGLYEYYIFGQVRSRGIWTAAIALAALSVVLFFFTLLWSWGIYLIAIVLIAIGFWLVWRSPRFR